MKGLWRSPAFLAGLALRLAFLPLFGSTFLRDLFIPFVDQGVLDPLSNPWAHLSPAHFPYGTALYVILWVPKTLAHLFAGELALGAGPIGLAAMKAPLLLLDLLLLQVLRRRAPDRDPELLAFYWLNPVLFYITYVHGQLDVASMALCVLSLDLLARRRTVASALAMAVAANCKFHVVLVVPLAMAFLWNREFAVPAARRIGTWLGVFAATAALGFLPQMLAGRIEYVSVGSPEALRLFAARIDLGQGQMLYLGVATVLLVLGRLCVSSRISEAGLFSGAAALFGTLVLAVNPMPGWYFWAFPLFALGFAERLTAPRLLFWAAVVAYLARFVVVDLLPPEFAEISAGVSLAVLQATVVGILATLWTLAVRFEAPIDRRTRPLLIGIAGDSGAGKTTLAGRLADLFDPESTTVVPGDDYHRWERSDPSWAGRTHVEPAANDLDGLAVDSFDLRTGRAVRHPRYDHASGRFTPPRELRPGRLVVIEGLHALYRRRMRTLLDLRVFLQPDENVRLAWKVRRDLAERGHGPDHVATTERARADGARRHIDPQRAFADWILEQRPAGELTPADAIAGRLPPLVARHVLWNDAPVDALAAALEACGECHATVSPVGNDIDRIELDVTDGLTAATAARIANVLFPDLRQITRGRRAPRFHDGHAGVAQLVALALLTEDRPA